MNESIVTTVQKMKRLRRALASGRCVTHQSMRVAFLSNFTLKGIQDALFVQCCEAGIQPAFYNVDYRQYAQEILDPHSGLYAFGADLAVIFLDLRALMGDLYWDPYRISDAERKAWVCQEYETLVSLCEHLKTQCPAKILLHNFLIPEMSPLGILENRQDYGLVSSVMDLNERLRMYAKDETQIFCFDYDRFAAQLGQKHFCDAKMYYAGDMCFDWKQAPALANAYMTYIIPLMARSKKCLVLDLDQTLWGGVIGEDGLPGIHLGPDPEGRPYWDFQKYVLGLYRRGVILAINSKNNDADVRRALREHPHMILRENHFASIYANWDDKAANMQRIARDLNISFEHMVFMDDDPVQRTLIAAACPGVMVIDCPDDPAHFVQSLHEAHAFHALQLTNEDRQRGAFYAQQKQRRICQTQFVDKEAFLESLNMELSIQAASMDALPRMAQLSGRTNQFNMTTKRYQASELKAMLLAPDFWIRTMCVKDRFGDHGMTGLAIVKMHARTWFLDTFLVSCRVLGKGLEDAFLLHVIKSALQNGCHDVVGTFRPTAKNHVACRFFQKHHFVLATETKEETQWLYHPQPSGHSMAYPSYIHVKEEIVYEKA